MCKTNLLHALGEQRISSCFTNDEIGPLNDHNADEKCCVASELKNFPLAISLRKKHLKRNRLINKNQCCLQEQFH